MARTAKSSVTITGVKELQAFLKDQICEKDLREATGALRAGSKKIATDLLLPELVRAGNASSSPLAGRFGYTASAFADRIVIVKVGAKNPKLSNFRRGKDAKYRTGMAWGSEMGGSHYGTPRTASGYWVRPLVTGTPLFNKVQDAYREVIADILRRYGRYT